MSLINQERSSRGIQPLTPDSQLHAYARAHSRDMAAAGTIYHSDLDIGNCKRGENVGMASTVEAIHDGYMASPGHKDNILDDYTRFAVGITERDGTLYEAVVFRGYCVTPKPKPRPKAPAPKETVCGA